MDYETYEDLENEQIDTSMIKTCKRIRNLAKLDRISVDETEHRSGLNKHLFDYITYCGYDVLQYIKDYLSNLQPYMIMRRKDQEKQDSFICVIDNLYRVSVYIKLDAKQFEELIISFHEDNVRGVAKTNALIGKEINKHEMVPVFADQILAKAETFYGIKVFVQRGLKILPLSLRAEKCKDVFIVDRYYIDQELLGYCNDYIKDLYTSNLKLDFEQIEIFSMLQQISFTSYGRDTFSSISLLIDSLVTQNDFVSKDAADFALITFVQNLKLTSEQREEIISLLQQKFLVSSIKGISIILNRVEENISNNYLETSTMGNRNNKSNSETENEKEEQDLENEQINTNLAKSDSISVDETEHKNGLNKHLFNYQQSGQDIYDLEEERDLE